MIFNSSLSRPIGIALAFIVACALVIAATTNSYAQLIATLVAIWAVLGISWNILGGFAGLVSFGHAAFFGLGAYTVGILAEHWGISPWIGLAMSALVGAMAGVVIGAIAGYYRGWVDAVLMRFTDIVIVIPIIVIGAVVGSAAGNLGPVALAVMLGFFAWTGAGDCAARSFSPACFSPACCRMSAETLRPSCKARRRTRRYMLLRYALSSSESARIGTGPEGCLATSCSYCRLSSCW